MTRTTSFYKTAASAIIVLGCLAAAAMAADANGTWKWKFTGQNGQEVDSALTLKQDGEKLTGTITRGAAGRSVEIKDGAIKDGEISFTTTVERNGNSFTSKYKGKVEGDTIKGKIENNRNGETRTRDWEATREKK
jgi:hypothetical protein